jgi:hypothetical protein
MYDKSILAKSTGASLGVVAVVGMLFLSTGTAFALPIAGIGGFNIQADSIAGDDLFLYPGDGNAENTQLYPQAIVELNSVEIDGLILTKEWDLGPNGYGVTPSDTNARVVISAGSGSDNVTSGQLFLKTPKLSADTSTFQGLEITENTIPDANKNKDTISQSLELRAGDDNHNFGEADARQVSLDNSNADPGLQLRGANIQATYLATNEITLPGLALQVQFDGDGDGNYDSQANDFVAGGHS